MARRVKPYRCGYPCDHLIDPASPPALDTCSYGGGHQSTALLVLSARRVLSTRTYLFCNVGDDSEHPGTLEYVRHIAMPYAAHHGIDLQELQRVRRDGTPETLVGRLEKPGSRSLPIPVRMSNGAPGTRSCTSDFKIKVVGRWLKRHGATGPTLCPEHSPCGDDGAPVACASPAQVAACTACSPGNPARVSIGISLDEIQRANTRVKDPWERIVYPLVGLPTDLAEVDLAMRRDDCDQLVASEPLPPAVAEQVRAAVAEGSITARYNARVLAQLERSDYTRLPVPPKSSCFFCPFHRPSTWADLARETPELFERSADLEAMLSERRAALGKDPVYLTRYAIPLRQAIDTDALLLPGMNDGADAGCDSGSCWT